MSHEQDFDMDWKANPDDVMEQVNECLAKHGLKFTELDSGGDAFVYKLSRSAK